MLGSFFTCVWATPGFWYWYIDIYGFTYSVETISTWSCIWMLNKISIQSTSNEGILPDGSCQVLAINYWYILGNIYRDIEIWSSCMRFLHYIDGCWLYEFSFFTLRKMFKTDPSEEIKDIYPAGYYGLLKSGFKRVDFRIYFKKQ